MFWCESKRTPPLHALVSEKIQNPSSRHGDMQRSRHGDGDEGDGRGDGVDGVDARRAQRRGGGGARAARGARRRVVPVAGGRARGPAQDRHALADASAAERDRHGQARAGHVPRPRLRDGHGARRLADGARAPRAHAHARASCALGARARLPVLVAADQLQLRGDQARRQEQPRAELHPLARRARGRRALDGRPGRACVPRRVAALQRHGRARDDAVHGARAHLVHRVHARALQQGAARSRPSSPSSASARATRAAPSARTLPLPRRQEPQPLRAAR